MEIGCIVIVSSNNNHGGRNQGEEKRTLATNLTGVENSMSLFH